MKDHSERHKKKKKNTIHKIETLDILSRENWIDILSGVILGKLCQCIITLANKSSYFAFALYHCTHYPAHKDMSYGKA